jgi:predicted glycosyltransferase
VVPEDIPQDRLDGLGATERKVRRFAGLEEEYYLSGFEPDPAVLSRLGLDAGKILAVVRTPPDVALYHRHGNPLFTGVLRRLGSDDGVRAVVLPRTAEQRRAIAGLGLPSLVVPEQAIDAQSLVALSDLVVSAGGTMNREAAALGVPAFTTFAGRMGAVDEGLVRAGRLRELRSPDELVVEKRSAAARRVMRDPAILLDLMFGALDS